MLRVAGRRLKLSSSISRFYPNHAAQASSIFTRNIVNSTSSLDSSTRSNCFGSIRECRPAFGIGTRRSFSQDVSQMPAIADPEIKNAFKDLMASSWDELPEVVIHDAKKALSKSTEDKSGQETLTNVFRAAQAVEEFSGILVSMKMELDDVVGLSGENVQPLSEEFKNALIVAHERYVKYLESFGPDEVYLRKKVETELGSKMIHLKMRCAGLGSEWGKVSVLGTSGLSGSYIEQRG